MSSQKFFNAVAGIFCILVCAAFFTQWLHFLRGQRGVSVGPGTIVPSPPRPDFPISLERQKAIRRQKEIEAIKDAIKKADEAESKARYNRSAEGLEEVYVDGALTAERQGIEELVRTRTRVQSRLTRIDFNDVRYVVGSDTATVLVTETWNSRTMSAEPDSLELSQQAEHIDVCPQKVALVRRDGAWLVSGVEHFPSTTSTPAENSQSADTDEDDDEMPRSEDLARIRERYQEREEAFTRHDVEGYFAYALPEWEWSAEGGDHATLAESKDYYRRVFASGQTMVVTTQIVKAYALDKETILVGSITGTAQTNDQANLIGQADLWVKRDEDWYCFRERRLASTGAFDLSELREHLNDDQEDSSKHWN